MHSMRWHELHTSAWGRLGSLGLSCSVFPAHVSLGARWRTCRVRVFWIGTDDVVHAATLSNALFWSASTCTANEMLCRPVVMGLGSTSSCGAAVGSCHILFAADIKDHHSTSFWHVIRRTRRLWGGVC
jgi:hypothetical protein